MRCETDNRDGREPEWARNYGWGERDELRESLEDALEVCFAARPRP